MIVNQAFSKADNGHMFSFERVINRIDSKLNRPRSTENLHDLKYTIRHNKQDRRLIQPTRNLPMSSVHSSRIRTISVLIFLFLLASTFSSHVFAVSNPCDPDFVSVDASGDFFVLPSMDMTGVTDTTNLQCTNNAIENQPFHAVKLDKGTFYIKEVTLNCPTSKSCTFAGTTRADTILEVVDDSIDCRGQLDNNFATGGLSFRGTITVQFMTIRGDSPCMGDGFLPGLIVFTGEPAVMGDMCGNSVLFGNLNRVDVEAQSFEVDAGVVVAPQGRYIGDTVCQDGLSGSFTSTRTYIDGPAVGIVLSMQSGARVGLDFFESTNSTAGAIIFDSNTITEVNFCTISGTATPDFDFWGLAVIQSQLAPNTTTTNISKCTFNIESEAGAFAALGVNVQDFAPPSAMPTVVSASTFNQMGDDTFGIEFGDVSNCTVTGNRFNGSGGNAIALFAPDIPTSGCTVTANTGLETFSAFFDDIFAGAGTLDNVLGFHPGAIVVDGGCNFDLNDPTGGCALAGGALLRNSTSADTPMSSRSRLATRQQAPASGHGFRQFRQALMRRGSANLPE